VGEPRGGWNPVTLSRWIFDFGQKEFHGMDIVNGKERRNSHSAGHGRQQPRHPIVAVDQVRLDARDDIVDDFPLKSK